MHYNTENKKVKEITERIELYSQNILEYVSDYLMPIEYKVDKHKLLVLILNLKNTVNHFLNSLHLKLYVDNNINTKHFGHMLPYLELWDKTKPIYVEILTDIVLPSIECLIMEYVSIDKMYEKLLRREISREHMVSELSNMLLHSVDVENGMDIITRFLVKQYSYNNYDYHDMYILDILTDIIVDNEFMDTFYNDTASVKNILEINNIRDGSRTDVIPISWNDDSVINTKYKLTTLILTNKERV